MSHQIEREYPPENFAHSNVLPDWKPLRAPRIHQVRMTTTGEVLRVGYLPPARRNTRRESSFQLREAN